MKQDTLTLKIDNKTKTALDSLSKARSLDRSKLIREAITQYIYKETKTPGAMLRDMAIAAKHRKNTAPKDIVENLDKYLYEKI